MPKMMGTSHMREEKQAQDEQRHEEIILMDHDALLLLFTLSKRIIAPGENKRSDGGNPHA
jgi:hypothetical protein